MADKFSDYLLDNGLTVLDTEATHIYICSADPTDYAEALSLSLGNKSFGSGGAFGAPADATPSGRKVTSTAIVRGGCTATGTATKWAVVDSGNTRLLANGSMATSVGTVVGGLFDLPPFVIQLPASA